ncbi:MAG: asparagine synthase (glutamine-hydrolyzing) [Planctomycetes bacterium]|nr:asparagine synthase (glutamine-hydrolyzing) [Planctomycetota bacterium]
MCGIFGVVGPAAEQLSEGALVELLARMQHRGPDGHGIHVEPGVRMGMRRLAVIDLAGGDQPFTSRDGEVVAFQNGEIYNHRELQRELEALGYRFRSHCDTEVLAHGFAAWGINGLLARLDGMFALAILDRRARRLHLARDRFGEKPLFFSLTPRDFAWSSDLRLLRTLPFVDRSIDPLALDRYLALHFAPGERTLFAGVQRLLPGERSTFDLDHVQLSREIWYRPDRARGRGHDREELLAIARRAVRSRLEAEVPLGVFLSGGLDSSLLTALAVEAHPAISTFSMGFTDPTRDESAEAREVAAALGTTHHHFVFDEHEFRRLLPDVVAALDEPIGDQATLPLYWLCREARGSVTVVLSGEGADEAFGGYGYYAGPGLRGLAGAGRPHRLLDGAGNTSLSGFPLLTSAEERRRLCPGLARDDDRWEHGCVARIEAFDGSATRARSVADTLTWLPDDLLVKFDRMAMAHSLEGRAPYLAPELFEYGLALPDDWRLHRGVAKRALRDAAGGLLPERILQTPKRGFVLPMRDWLASWFAAVGDLGSYVAERAPAPLDVAATTELIAEDLRRGVKRERLLFALLVLLEWNARSAGAGPGSAV